MILVFNIFKQEKRNTRFIYYICTRVAGMGNADRHRQRQQQLVTRSIAEGDAVWDANKLTLSKRKGESCE